MALNPALVLQNINPARPYTQSTSDINDLLNEQMSVARENTAMQSGADQSAKSQYELGQQQLEDSLNNPIRKLQAAAALAASQPDNVPPQLKAQVAPEQQAQPVLPPSLNSVHANINPNLNPPAQPSLSASVNLPPMMQPQAQSDQKAPVTNDRYGAQEQAINQEQDLLDKKKVQVPLLAYNPSDPSATAKNAFDIKQKLADEQTGINQKKFGLGVNRAWDQALPGINDFLQSQLGKNNGYLNEGDYNLILGKVESVVSQNPSLAKADGYKELTTMLEKAKPQPVFNPELSKSRDIPSLRQRSTADAKTYQTSKDALNAAEAEYSNYIKDPNSSTNRVDQQGIIDKYTMVSLGKSPTEAQLQLAQAFPGIDNWFDLASGHLKTGQIIPKAAVDEMMRNMRGTVINYGQNLKTKNAVVENAAELGGIDPARVLNVPSSVVTADSTRFANAPGMAQQGQPKIGDTKQNSHGLTVVYGPKGWALK
jgi:hypothetical protein